MPRQYPPGFRDVLVERMLNGEPVLTIRDDTGVPEQTVQRRKQPGVFNVSTGNGIDSTYSAALNAAHNGMRLPQKEVLLVKCVSEIDVPLTVVDPRVGSPSP